MTFHSIPKVFACFSLILLYFCPEKGRYLEQSPRRASQVLGVDVSLEQLAIRRLSQRWASVFWRVRMSWSSFGRDFLFLGANRAKAASKHGDFDQHQFKWGFFRNVDVSIRHGDFSNRTGIFQPQRCGFHRRWLSLPSTMEI